MVFSAKAFLVYLVYLVCFVCLVCLPTSLLDQVGLLSEHKGYCGFPYALELEPFGHFGNLHRRHDLIRGDTKSNPHLPIHGSNPAASRT